MNKFGFVIHNTSWDLIAKAFDEPYLYFTPQEAESRRRTYERVLRWTDPFYCSDICGIKSKTGKEIGGFFIFSLLVPEQYLNMDESVVLKHLKKSADMAKERGAKILGLGAYTALVGKRGWELAKMVDIPVTTGSAYTIATTIDSALHAAKIAKLDLAKSNCLIVGATGKIGKVCAMMLTSSAKIGGLYLVARNKARLDELANELREFSPGCEIILSTELKDVIKQADLILFTTNYPDALVSADDFSRGAVICDVSVPKNVPVEVFQKRDDILLFEGGIIKPPGDVNFNFFFGPPTGFAYACIAETMILTLEEMFENYSLGSNVSLKKVKEIKELGDKHGFTLDDLHSQYGVITDSRVAKAAQAIALKRKSLGAR